MPKNRSSEVLYLGELLGGTRVFVLPMFQRGFAWLKAEVDQFVDDLVLDLVSRPNGDSFLGTISIVDPPPKGRPLFGRLQTAQRKRYISDGQQRLAMLTMVIAYLRDKLGSKAGFLAPLVIAPPARPGNPGEPRIRLSHAQQAFFATHVQTPGAMLGNVPNPGPHDSNARLHEARRRVQRALKALEVDELHALATGLRDRCEVSIVVSTDITTAHETFVRLNYRGKALAIDELIRAFIVEGLDDARSRALAAQWDRLSERVTRPDEGEDTVGQKAFESMLSHAVFLARGHEPTIVAGFLKMFEAQDDILSRVLVPAAEHYVHVTRVQVPDSELAPQIRRELTYLNWQSTEIWVPVAMAIVEQYASAPAEQLRALKSLHRLAVSFLIGGNSKTRQKTRYFALIKQIRDGGGTGFDDGVFTIAPPSLQALTNTVANGLYESRGQGQACMHVLSYLSAEMFGIVSAHHGKSSTEHVLPLSAEPASEWRRVIPDATVREAAENSIGNITLLGKQTNHEAGNLSFGDKQRVYFKAGETEFPLTNELRDLSVFDAQTILEREQRLMTKLTELWALPHYTSNLELAIRAALR